MKNILLVDSDPIMLHTFVGLLKNQSNFLTFFPANSIDKAIDIFSVKKIHLIITGMHLPEADTYNLAAMMANDAAVRIIILGNSSSAEFKNKIRGMNHIIHFNHVRDMGMLIKRIFFELHISYGGQLQGMSLASFLQIMEMEERSGTFLITTKGKTGTLTFTNGKPVAAKTKTNTGKKALMEILTWEKVCIDIDYTPNPVPNEIKTSLMNLLLESGKTMDELRLQLTSLRKHKRLDCQLSAEYRIGNWTFQCHLLDISLGGAFIETDQPVQVGQKLLLSLSASTIDSACRIKATTVRRETNGIGVRFESLSPEQTHSLRLYLKTYGLPVSASAA